MTYHYPGSETRLAPTDIAELLPVGVYKKQKASKIASYGQNPSKAFSVLGYPVQSG